VQPQWWYQAQEERRQRSSGRGWGQRVPVRPGPPLWQLSLPSTTSHHQMPDFTMRAADPCPTNNAKRAKHSKILKPGCFFVFTLFYQLAYSVLCENRPVVIYGKFCNFFPCTGFKGLRWLLRFKLIRLRRISLATLRRDGLRDGWMYGLMDGYLYIIDCLRQLVASLPM
jgi:hypothetical protein